MKKVLLAVATAVLGSAILAGGIAQADDYKKRYKGYDVLATGLTLCPVDNVAVFPATNISRRPIRVWVSCVDTDGNEFPDSPVRTKLDGGQAVTLQQSCNDTRGLVRCTIAARKGSIERVRGVLHIIGDLGFVVTEATNVSHGDYDDDD